MKDMNISVDQILKAPTIEEIRSAARVLKGVGVVTPLLESLEVNARLSGRLLIKAETMQRMGAFKFRGAYNRISSLSKSELKRGVMAYSSGNHAQAVACAAKLMGTRALIVMPEDAPTIKLERTRALGAEIVSYDRNTENREQIAEEIRVKKGYILVPPFEDRRVLAGAGTAALEIIEQSSALGTQLDAVLVPCGGGGLTAGTAIAFAALSKSTKVIAVEPADFDDTKRSFQAGERLSNPKNQSSICDAIMTDQPGELTFSINREHVSEVLTVSDQEVQEAMAFAFEQYKMVIEPGAAVGLAAILSNKIEMKGRTIATIASGGNVDPSVFCAALKAAHT